MFQHQFDVSSYSPIELLDIITTPYNQTNFASTQHHDDDCDIIQSFFPVEEVWHISRIEK